MNAIFESLDDTCIRFTKIYTFKDQLLKQIFNNNTTLNDDNNKTIFTDY